MFPYMYGMIKRFALDDSSTDQTTPLSRFMTVEKNKNHTMPEELLVNQRPNLSQKHTTVNHSHGLDLSVSSPHGAIVERPTSITVSEQVTLVDWDGPDDPANPKK